MNDDDDHEVQAFYDNMAGVAAGDKYGWPTLSCSCGFTASGRAWDEAGAAFDEHLMEIRREA